MNEAQNRLKEEVFFHLKPWEDIYEAPAWNLCTTAQFYKHKTTTVRQTEMRMWVGLVSEKAPGTKHCEYHRWLLGNPQRSQNWNANNRLQRVSRFCTKPIPCVHEFSCCGILLDRNEECRKNSFQCCELSKVKISKSTSKQFMFLWFSTAVSSRRLFNIEALCSC